MKSFFTLLLVCSFLFLSAQDYGIKSIGASQEYLTKVKPTDFRVLSIDSPNDLWQSYPIFGGEMTSLAMDSENTDIIYVGTRGAGIFKTIDGGQNWTPVNSGLLFYPVRSLVIDPQDSEIIYAGTDYAGIWKSIDGGENWIWTSFDGDLIVFNIVINPQNPQILYVASAGGVGLDVGQFHKSIDGGETWLRKEDGLADTGNGYTNGIFSVTVDSSDPDILYAGSNYKGVYKTVDGADTWTNISNGVPESSPGFLKSINALAIDINNPEHLGALIQGDYFIFDSTQWNQINEDFISLGESIGPGNLYFHTSDANTIYNNKNYSIDGGKTWQNWIDNSDDDRHQIVDLVLPNGDFTNILAASKPGVGNSMGGIIASNDMGMSWQYSFNGITARPIRSIETDPINHDLIYAGTGENGNFFTSHDGGETWMRGFNYTWYQSDSVNQKSFNFSQIYDIAINPLNRNEIYFAASTGLWKSVDFGIEFNKIDFVQNPTCIEIVANEVVSTVYVGTESEGILKSTDSGMTWEQKNEGIPLSPWGDVQSIPVITIDPNNLDVIWAGTGWNGGIIKSENGGDSWTVMGLENEIEIISISIDPNNSDELLAGSFNLTGSKLFKTSDGGLTWKTVLKDSAPIYEMARDPRDPQVIYAVSEGYYVLRSIDGGETWNFYDNGLFYPLHYSIEITDEEKPKMITGSYGSGLYWACPSLPVKMFQAITSSNTEIDLSWELNVNNDEVMLAWSTDGIFGEPVDSTEYNSGEDIAGGGTVIYTGSTTSFNHTFLNPGTYYYYKMWAKEGDLKYSTGETDYAYTLCESNFPIEEDFSDGFLPVCWEIEDERGDGYEWFFDNPGERTFNSTSGENGFALIDIEYYQSFDSFDVSLISPVWHFPTESSYRLSFEHCFSGFGFGAAARLLYSIDNGLTWQQLGIWENNTGTPEVPALFDMDVTAQVGGYYDALFKWNYSGDFGKYWLIDDVHISMTTNTSVINNADAIDIFPNPSNGVLEFIFQKEKVDGNLIITDISGKAVFQTKLSSSHHRLDLSFLDAGLYLAHIQLGGESVVRNFLIY